MWIILDVITVCLLLFFIISGTRKGLIASLGNIAVTLCAVIVTFYCTSYVASFFQSTVVYGTLTSRVEKKVTDYIDDMADEEELMRLLDTSPREIVTLFDAFGVKTSDVADKCGELIEEGEKNVAASVCDYIVTPAAKSLSKALAAFVLFFGTILIAKLAIFLVGLLFKLPVLKSVNHFGGFVFGIAAGFIVCCLFCTVCGIALPYLKGAGIALDPETARSAVIYSFFAKINPLSFLV